MEYPLKKVLQRPDLSGRLVNWDIGLGQFDIEFHPWVAIKGQALADFLVETCGVPEVDELSKNSTWVIYVDGSSAGGCSGAGVVLTGLGGERFNYAIKLDFNTTNNEAEYEAVMAGLSVALSMGIANLEVRSDSQVIVRQVIGGFDVQEDRMTKYLDKVRQFQSHFDRIVLTKIPREQNSKANTLPRAGSRTEQKLHLGK
jgi:ribonuclease HI